MRVSREKSGTVVHLLNQALYDDEEWGSEVQFQLSCRPCYVLGGETPSSPRGGSDTAWDLWWSQGQQYISSPKTSAFPSLVSFP